MCWKVELNISQFWLWSGCAGGLWSMISNKTIIAFTFIIFVLVVHCIVLVAPYLLIGGWMDEYHSMRGHWSSQSSARFKENCWCRVDSILVRYMMGGKKSTENFEELSHCKKLGPLWPLCTVLTFLHKKNVETITGYGTDHHCRGMEHGWDVEWWFSWKF